MFVVCFGDNFIELEQSCVVLGDGFSVGVMMYNVLVSLSMNMVVIGLLDVVMIIVNV